MNNTIKFKEIANTGFMESDSYIFNRDEMIEVFKAHTAIGSDIQTKITNHEHVSIELPQNRNIKIHFWVDSGSSDKWVMNITIPVNTETILPQKIKEILANKNPINS